MSVKTNVDIMLFLDSSEVNYEEVIPYDEGIRRLLNSSEVVGRTNCPAEEASVVTRE